MTVLITRETGEWVRSKTVDVRKMKRKWMSTQKSLFSIQNLLAGS